jgi:very-short-patch-repair endonuclease
MLVHMRDLPSLTRGIRVKVTERLRALADLAGRQGGVVAMWQLLDLGFSEDTVQRWLACGRLHRIHRGVYALGHEAIGLKGRLMGAVIACGRDAALSHRSAAAWWALLPSDRPLVDVTDAARHRRKGIDAHQMQLHARDLTVHEDIPVTTIARTLLDLAEVVPQRRLAKAVETAERRNLFDLTSVQDVLQRSPGRRGHRQLRSLLSHYTTAPLTRSELEEAFWELVHEEDLPRPQGNASVGPYEVDFLWQDQKVVVELDSWEYHGTREAFERDRERDLELQLAGYTVIRVTHRRLTQDRTRLARQLRTLLGLR